MKKLSILLGVALVALGFSSCSEDRDPKYTAPTEFVLNVPVLQSQYIELTDGNTLDLVCSQPDYGYSAVANYSAEISLTEDFSKFEAIMPIDDHKAAMSFKQEDLALAICNLFGLDSEDSYNAEFPDGMPYMTLYFRAVCQLAGVESSLIKSNVVSYENIKPYFAVKTPGYIYMIGSVGGWTSPDEANAAALAKWRLYEPDNAIGSHVYSGKFDLPSAPMFRFYTALTGWDADSYGSQEEDNPIDYPEFTGADSWTGTMIKGKGSFNFPNFTGGEVTVVVDMSDPENMTVTLVSGDYTPVVTTYVYMVGNNGGWTEPVEGTYEDWKLADTTGSGVYAATFDFTDFSADGGVLYCRFYQQLTGWGAAQWSSDAGGGNVEVASGVSYPTYVGEGCFQMPATGHHIEVVLDTNNDEVTFTYVD